MLFLERFRISKYKGVPPNIEQEAHCLEGKNILDTVETTSRMKFQKIATHQLIGERKTRVMHVHIS